MTDGTRAGRLPPGAGVNAWHSAPGVAPAGPPYREKARGSPALAADRLRSAALRVVMARETAFRMMDRRGAATPHARDRLARAIGEYRKAEAALRAAVFGPEGLPD